MTPKEKAKELMQKAYDLDQHNKTTQNKCKQIALLCVDEILDTIKGIAIFKTTYEKTKSYWTDVRTEIGLIKNENK